jgi:aminoglycoside 3-N-acetyltransferase
MTFGRERNALLPILRRCDVTSSGVLVVHSAIASLSRNGFRAEAMIEAFLEHMSSGTVVMPTMSWRGVTLQHPEWDELKTPSETGVLSEVFRTRYASTRSIHPTHSVAALGKVADILVARHHLDSTPVSANSPYGLMRKYDSYIMMIGVGLECCTALHLPEELIAPDVYLRPLNRDEVYRCKDRRGNIHTMHARRHWGLDRDFPQFGPPLVAEGHMQTGQIEGCSYAVVGLNHVLDKVTIALLADNKATLRQDARVA